MKPTYHSLGCDISLVGGTDALAWSIQQHMLHTARSIVGSPCDSIVLPSCYELKIDVMLGFERT